MAHLLAVPRILWGALLASQVVYAVFVGVPLVPLSAQPADTAMLMMLASLAAGCVIVSFVVPRALSRSAMRKYPFDIRDVPDRDVPVGFRQEAKTKRVFVDPSAVQTAAVKLGLPSFIVELALSEAVSLLGLVSAFLGASPAFWSVFFLVGMTMTAIRFPTANRFFSPVERETQIALSR